ncbi:MAG: LysM peptidoglycan-binding domain-containing protein [Bdellovibrionota bacterium]
MNWMKNMDLTSLKILGIMLLLGSNIALAQEDDFLLDGGGSSAFGTRTELESGANAVEYNNKGKDGNDIFSSDDDLGFGDNSENFDLDSDNGLGLNSNAADSAAQPAQGDSLRISPEKKSQVEEIRQPAQTLSPTATAPKDSFDSGQAVGSNFYDSGVYEQNLQQPSGLNEPASSVLRGEVSVPASSTGSTDMLDNYEIKADPIESPNEFSGVPPIPGSLGVMADGEAPEEYYVESGDTLFDICSQLLDEGGYWPKLWSLNPQIKNPHFVWPGMKLSFYPGDEETPPYLEVVSEEDVVPIDKGELAEEVLLHGQIPDFEQNYVQTITKVVGVEDVTGAGELDGQIIESGVLFSPTNRKFTIPGFIFPEEKKPLAVVIGGTEGEVLVGEERQALVQLDSPVSKSTTYTVLRELGEVDSLATGDFLGYHYDFVANIRIIANIDESEMAIVQATETRHGLRAGDIIVPYISTMRTVPIENQIGSISSSDARVVGFGSAGRIMGGENQLLFIDRGATNGISNGQYFYIFSSPGASSMSDMASKLSDVKLPVAVVKIVDVTPVAALGYVVKSEKEIRVGDALSKGQIKG